MKEMMKRCLSLGASLSVVVLMRMRGISISGPSNATIAKDPELPVPPRPVPAPIAQLPPTANFSGTVVRDGSRFALRKHDGTLHGFDSAGRAWPFEGEDVSVAGYIHPESKLLHICSIEAIDDLRAEAV